MNILDFLNSKDVRCYLNEIDYQFSLLEQAYIIYKSRFRGVKEKQKAFKELVDSTDDYILGSDGNKRWCKSVIEGQSTHALILQYIHDLTEFVGTFYAMKSDEYCQVFFILDSTYEEPYADNLQESGYIFANVEDALSYVIDEVKNDEDCGNHNYIGFEIRKGSFKRPEIEVVNKVSAIYNLNGTLLEIDSPYDFYGAAIDIEKDFFEQMWFDIPVPFKRGDIVRGAGGNWGRTTEPFILLTTYPEMKRRAKERTGKSSEGCDASDMNASGWSTGFYENNPLFVSDDVMADYLDLEYYNGEFIGPQRLLLLMAKHISKEIDIWEYTYGYRQIVSEYEHERAKKEMGTFLIHTSPVYKILDEIANYENS
ncbi:hypothetical protein [Pseudobutyrivibrio sp. MD2005]|uniref:hypothetical protein n=1 Tax=Pseudobutyrivibrio sp. MD2005 TaxID=1410616 RepID=UPI000481D79E|nr:hypothetical protein [Pseudobutyrivibrio sp. MD2005]